MIGVVSTYVVGPVLHGYRVRLIRSELYYNEWVDIALALTPLSLCALLAVIFVYRHTARRRKTQAALTMILVLLLAFLTAHALAWLIPPPPLVY